MLSVLEPLALGFASGPLCLATCGPVLLPWLGAEARGVGVTARLLAIFLGGRLAGYLGFAVVAWAAGWAIPGDLRARALIFGLANLGLAVLLGLSACFLGRSCAAAGSGRRPRLYQIGASDRFRPPAALTLGFLTGLNLCPPFVAAGVRAATAHSLAGALIFFTLFFAGTSAWFLPSLAVSSLGRFAVVETVARITMAVLAIYYLYLGVMGVASWRLAAARTGNLEILGRVFHA
jgi:sulfite exporter TauE/SafE